MTVPGAESGPTALGAVSRGDAHRQTRPGHGPRVRRAGSAVDLCATSDLLRAQLWPQPPLPVPGWHEDPKEVLTQKSFKLFRRRWGWTLAFSAHPQDGVMVT